MVSRTSPKLDKKQVIETALQLLNEVGLEGLTLRAIARELNVQAPALYWHFRNKQSLLDEMATEIYRRMAAGARLTPDDTWQERLLRSNCALRTALLAHRDGARVISGSPLTNMKHAGQRDDSLRLLIEAGFTLAQAVHASSTTYLFTLGFVTEEQSVKPIPGERREGYDSQQCARRLADYSLFTAAGAEIFENSDRYFEESLGVIVAGIGATVFGTGGAHPDSRGCTASPPG